MAREKAENTGIFPIGTYNCVQLVPEDFVEEASTEIALIKYRRARLIGSIFSGTQGTLNPRIPYARIARHVIREGAVGIGEINKIPKGKNRQEAQYLAEMLPIIQMEYKAVEDEGRSEGKILPYQLGLVLSDFIEVIPTEVGSRILNSASNPEISEDVKTMYAGINFNLDSQTLATEAVALLPTQKRRDIFEEMVSLDPRQEGRASLFFRSIVSNFHVSGSPLSAVGNIRANLQGIEAEEKILEIQGDLSTIGSMIRSKFK